MVEFPTDTETIDGHSEAPEAFPVSFSTATSGAPSALNSETTTQSAPATLNYSTVAPLKDVFTKSNRPCFICLSTARLCDDVKYLPDDMRKAIMAREEEFYHVRRTEGSYRRPNNQKTTGTLVRSTYLIPFTTPVSQSQVNMLEDSAELDKYSTHQNQLPPAEPQENYQRNAYRQVVPPLLTGPTRQTARSKGEREPHNQMSKNVETSVGYMQCASKKTLRKLYMSLKKPTTRFTEPLDSKTVPQGRSRPCWTRERDKTWCIGRSCHWDGKDSYRNGTGQE